MSRSTDLRRGARVREVDHHDRLLDVRDLVDAQILQREQAQAHEHDDDGNRRDRLLDAEIRKKHGVSLLRRGSYFSATTAGLASTSPVDRLPVLERGVRKPQHLVAFGQARLDARYAPLRASRSPSVSATLLQFVAVHAPRECVVAFAHHGCAGQSEACGAASLDAAFGVQAGDIRAAASRRRNPPALRPGAWWHSPPD